MYEFHKIIITYTYTCTNDAAKGELVKYVYVELPPKRRARTADGGGDGGGMGGDSVASAAATATTTTTMTMPDGGGNLPKHACPLFALFFSLFYKDARSGFRTG